MSEEPDVEEQDGALTEVFEYEPLPSYLMLADGPLKDEARRVHCLELLRLGEGTLCDAWSKDAPAVEAFLKGTKPKLTAAK